MAVSVIKVVVSISSLGEILRTDIGDHLGQSVSKANHSGLLGHNDEDSS